MQILIRSTKIIDPQSKWHGKVADLLVQDGVILSIGKNLDPDGVDEIVEGDDLHVSAGWVDLYATFGDPGKEYKEDIISGLNAAAQGGFTKVAVSPETFPAVDSKSGIEYLLNRSAKHAVDALPIGAISKGLHGKELAEMFDMQSAGAVAVSNGKHSLDDTKLQNLAFLYTRNLNLVIYSFCQDSRLAGTGQMHEGNANTSIGLKGIPALAEEVIVSRDLYLAEYSDVSVHFSHVTTKGSVALIREAKAKGLKVTCSVPAHHLFFSDETLADFDPNLKVKPPFRSAEHIEALIEGLADSTIDAIISDHEPHEIEAKFSEFSNAEAGIVALETAFSAAVQTLAKKLDISQIVDKFTSGPRKVLNLENPKVAEGQEAELTIFSPSLSWTLNRSDIKSRSKNSPLIGQTLTGLPIAIINKGKFVLNS